MTAREPNGTGRDEPDQGDAHSCADLQVDVRTAIFALGTLEVLLRCLPSEAFHDDALFTKAQAVSELLDSLLVQPAHVGAPPDRL